MAASGLSLEDFLRPLDVNVEKIHSLARRLAETYSRLAAESTQQFLSTPISESLLRPSGTLSGRYLAIDIGGTNLRVGFIELLGPTSDSHEIHLVKSQTIQSSGEARVKRHLEKSWPIGEHLKNEKAEDLFAWIGKCIAQVVQDGCEAWPGEIAHEIPLGITFSFPMVQHSLSEATLMSMGKGFAITSNLDLGTQLLASYETAQGPSLPQIKIAAIVNDAVATLVSFAYQVPSTPQRKATMGLIVGTGCNATIPLALSKLHPSKRPKHVKVLDGAEADEELKVTVNTEWTINGAVAPLHELNLITQWDRVLDSECEAPGFQPFEYMTAGRYLGELGRIMILEYFTKHLRILNTSLPPKLLQRNGLTTSFLGNLRTRLNQTKFSIADQLQVELPTISEQFQWTEELATIVYRIGKTIQVRAAGMTAAAIIGLLACADEIKFSPQPTSLSTEQVKHSPECDTSSTAKRRNDVEDLMVGYTGGCIVHFQDYLQDCQQFLDEIMQCEFGEDGRQRVLLWPCHDGGIIGAGILAGTVHSRVHDT